jgi:hypothetical protein
MLTDSKVRILSCLGLVESSSKVSTVIDVITGRSMENGRALEIGRSRDVVGHKKLALM